MKNSKVRLICFTGIDGSGKTTLAKYLVETMGKNGFQCKYVYGRLEPFLLKPFISIGRKIFLREKDVFVDYKEYSNIKRKAIERNSFLFTFYRYILMFDYSLQILLKIRLPLMLGKNIVCDRYVYDTVITDLSVDMNYSYSEVRDLIKKCFYMAPKPDLAFLIDLPEEIAFQRKNDTPSIEYLKERKKIYLNVVNDEGIVVLDGGVDLKNLQKLIWDEFIENDKMTRKNEKLRIQLPVFIKL